MCTTLTCSSATKATTSTWPDIYGRGETIFSNDNLHPEQRNRQPQVGGKSTHTPPRGYFGRVNYDYDSKYFASVSYRRDASSRFTREHRWGNFWSVSAAWDLANESFMDNADWMDMFVQDQGIVRPAGQRQRRQPYYPWPTSIRPLAPTASGR